MNDESDFSDLDGSHPAFAKRTNIALGWFIAAAGLGPVAGFTALIGVVCCSRDWLFGGHAGEGIALLVLSSVYAIACATLWARGSGGRRIGAAVGLGFFVVGLSLGLWTNTHGGGGYPFG